MYWVRQKPFYNKELAEFLLHMCVYAYRQYVNNGPIEPIPGFKLVHSFKAKANGIPEWFGFILESDDAIVIAFRGTQSDADWVADASISQTPFLYGNNGGLVHSGFQSVYASCRDEIFKKYALLSKQKNLFITGHSLGGALAILHAADAALNAGFRSIVMYNYGAPRVGDGRFASFYDQAVPNSIRFVNTADLVPKLPPFVVYNPLSKTTFFYQHVQTPFSFTADTGSIAGNHMPDTYFSGIEGMARLAYR
ncbi:lipase family protein [Bacillus mangrovi]|uniref:Lipase family protein n=1 Tax=Metabacillus mangrovi TaxID=1491830 RepID=A0A7X2V4P8_9BACI|nr:lipase family protein [Metabacillus mangrovi]MTH53625.1 lipase family protein [Metabacillus mangrovi]